MKIGYPGPGILQVMKVSDQDEGGYSCTASNSHGSVNRHFNLTVQAG